MDLKQYLNLLVDTLWMLDDLIYDLNITFFGVRVSLELIVGCSFFGYLISCILNNDGVNDIEDDDSYFD